MRTKKNMEQNTVPTEFSTEKKGKPKRGRRPMTAEEKEAAALARAAEKAKADNLKPELFVQYQEGEVDMALLVEAARADFRKSNKRTLVTAMRIYYKPEEGSAYYVINDKYEGKVNI